jgi:hypothetical protein
MTLINVSDDYRIRSSASFSTPVRALGMKINIDFEDIWNRGLNFVNDIENVNTNLTNKISLSIENRKKTIIDIIAGGSFQYTDARFSVEKSLNNRYTDISCFSELRYNPGKHFNLQFNTEITTYGSKSFGESVTIPLLSADASWYFMKNNRASFMLSGSDLLNRNTGIVRTSEFNYLREKRSNMLGRFFMLTFKYKLNKFADSGNNVDVRVKRR